MAVKGAKTIAEYAIRRWMEEQISVLENFQLSMDGNVGTLKDKTGKSLILVYDPGTKTVCVKEEREEVETCR